MKLRCTCGHVIVDQTDDLPYKAVVTPHKVEFAIAQRAAHDIALLIDACMQGQRDAFVAERFGPDYPPDLTNESIVLDLMHAPALGQVLNMYQCPECGRLLLDDRNRPSHVLSFAPEHDVRDALNIMAPTP